MIVTKDEFKQLQKEGGGALGVDCVVVAKLMNGISGIKHGAMGTTSVRKNGIFFDILMGQKAFIPIEQVESVTIDGNNLFIDTETDKMTFEIKKEKDLEKAYIAISRLIGVSVKTREQIQTEQMETKRQAMEIKRQALEDEGEIYCPKCLSTRLEVQKKGFGVGKAAVGVLTLGAYGLLAGGIGKNKLELTCLKCGHKFRPGK